MDTTPVAPHSLQQTPDDEHLDRAFQSFVSYRFRLSDIDSHTVFGLIYTDMALLDIVIAPHPVLRSPCQPVSTFDSQLHKLLDNMYESMVASNGIGLAAPQVAVSQMVAVIDVSSDAVEQPKIMSLADIDPAQHIYDKRLEIINPKITQSKERVSSEEGCLSIPDYRDTISRFFTVTVEAQDRYGRPFSATAVDYLAFAVQHEVDHLHGILFVDHLSRLKKTLFKRWSMKNLGSDTV
jgi:peptide deformylase